MALDKLAECSVVANDQAPTAAEALFDHHARIKQRLEGSKKGGAAHRFGEAALFEETRYACQNTLLGGHGAAC
jgi:hypothetical protein